MLGLCERFSCLPSQLYAEDAELGWMLNAEATYRNLTDPAKT